MIRKGSPPETNPNSQFGLDIAFYVKLTKHNSCQLITFYVFSHLIKTKNLENKSCARISRTTPPQPKTLKTNELAVNQQEECLERAVFKVF